MRQVLREGDIAISESLHINITKEVKAIQTTNQDSYFITSERYGEEFAAISIYESATLERKHVYVFPEKTSIPNVIRAIEGSDLILVNFYGHLCKINLKSKLIEGVPIEMRFRLRHLKRKKRYYKENEKFYVQDVGVYNNGKLITAHCGIAAPRMPSNLITWDSETGKILSGPIHTPDVNDSHIPTDDMAGIPDMMNKCYITSQRFGWVRYWNAEDLSLKLQWQIHTPSEYDRSIPTRANNEIQAIALYQSTSQAKLAVGTWSGITLVVDLETGKNLISPLIPNDFSYSQNTYGRKDIFQSSEVSSLAFFDSGKKLIVGFANGSIRFWDVIKGIQIRGILDFNPLRIARIFVPKHQQKAIVILDHVNREESNVRIVDLPEDK